MRSIPFDHPMSGIKMKKSTLLLCLSPFVLAFSGCALMSGPSDHPSDTPPHLIKGGDSGALWDSSRLFGPVPPEEQARGDGICKKLGFATATGFHPKAADLNGRPFKTGGFLCGGKAS